MPGDWVPGRVVGVRPHPSADRIWLADVDAGDGRIRQVVFGGVPVVTAGCLVPVVLPGMRAGGRKLRVRRYRGERSEGMLCSAAEAGLGAEDDRVLVLGR
jgi:phenylalanyl-tRNA synthetase beta chain